MSIQHHHMFTEGLFYEVFSDSFVEFDIDGEPDGDEEIVVIEPDNGEIDRLDPDEFDPLEYIAVPDRAVESPVGYFNGMLDILLEDADPDVERWAGFQYARKHVSVEDSGE